MKAVAIYRCITLAMCSTGLLKGRTPANVLFDTDVALNKVIVAMDAAPITSANWQYKPELRGGALILKIPHSSHDLLNVYSVVFT